MARKRLAELGRTELAHLPDWVFDPPRGRLSGMADGTPTVLFDGETPDQWRRRRDEFLERAGLPSARDGSREFRREFQAEARRRHSVVIDDDR